MTAFALDVPGGRLEGEADDHFGHGAAGLVLVHGFGGSRAMWDRVRAALPAALPVLRYDLRGFGGSTGEPGVSFSHADDLLRVMDAQGIERVTVAGLSLGGGVAAHFALEYPDRIARLCLVSPMLMGWDWSDDWRDRWRAISRAAKAGDIDKARALWWGHPLFDPVRDTTAGAELRAEIDRFPGRQWVRDDQAPVLPDVERLHALACPVLLLSGGLDLPDFLLMADAVAASAPQVRRVDYPDAGHMLPLERPAEVARELAAFALA